MMNIAFPSRIFLYRFPTDMRKSFEGLCGIVVNELNMDPIRDGMFAFVNKRRDKLKLLVWDRHGFWLLYKRLEKGTFQTSIDKQTEGKVIPIAIHELSLIIEGVDLSSIKMRKRFELKR